MTYINSIDKGAVLPTHTPSNTTQLLGRCVMSNTIYLYLKTHNKTGLKYLGKTVQNPHEYRGSGLVWNRHLDKHGDDVTTEILFKTKEMKEFKEVALEYSKKWNIVESKEFANLIPEYGTGGDTSMCFTDQTKEKIRTSLAKTRKGMDLFRSEETKKKISESRKGLSFSNESKKKMSESAIKRGFIKGSGFKKGHSPHNKGQNGYLSDRIWINNGDSNKRIKIDEPIPNGWVKGKTKFKMNKTRTCPHCGLTGSGSGMTRWHFDNCVTRK